MRSRVLLPAVGVAATASLVTTIVLAGQPAQGATSPPSATAEYAPLDATGPRLAVSAADMRRLLACSAPPAQARRSVVILVPGTTLTPQEHYGWSMAPALEKAGVPFCHLTLPGRATGDMQVSAEYVVAAIRSVAADSHRRVSLLGGSQGGSLPRWALRFWPDVRAKVDDVVALAGTNHGGTAVPAYCAFGANAGGVGGCLPALWQQFPSAQLMAALNSRAETFEGISYTTIASVLDPVTTPGDVALRTGEGRISNVVVQSVCPGRPADHIATASYDPVSLAVALDALTHAGPADPARIDPAVCGRLIPDGVDPDTFAANVLGLYAAVADQFVLGARVGAEPALRCYVFIACPPLRGSAGPGRAPR